jgi:HSP20 family protein
MAIQGFSRPGWGDPWQAFEDMRRELGSVLEDWGVRGSRGARGGVFPPVNLYETDREYVVTAELPGLQSREIEVSLEGQRLTLRGERRIEVPAGEGSSVHRRERQAGVFHRAVALPQPVDGEKVEASYRHGVLVVRVPKPAREQPRRIAVRAS